MNTLNNIPKTVSAKSDQAPDLTNKTLQPGTDFSSLKLSSCPRKHSVIDKNRSGATTTTDQSKFDSAKIPKVNQELKNAQRSIENNVTKLNLGEKTTTTATNQRKIHQIQPRLRGRLRGWIRNKLARTSSSIKKGAENLTSVIKKGAENLTSFIKKGAENLTSLALLAKQTTSTFIKETTQKVFNKCVEQLASLGNQILDIGNKIINPFITGFKAATKYFNQFRGSEQQDPYQQAKEAEYSILREADKERNAYLLMAAEAQSKGKRNPLMGGMPTAVFETKSLYSLKKPESSDELIDELKKDKKRADRQYHKLRDLS